MASAARVSANRSNARKSTGPRTPEGKATVAQNAVKHGLLGRAAVLRGEDWEEYTFFHEEMLEELYPDGMQEMELAERIVDLSWRLRRAGRYQNAVFEALYDQYTVEPAEPEARPDPIPSVPSDPVLGRMLLADFSGDRILERVLLYERRIESSLYRARAELRQLRCQPLRSAKRGSVSFDGQWDDSGGYRHTPPSAGADFTLETANSALAAEDSLCETNPIDEGVGVQGGAPIAVNRDWEPGSGVSDLTSDTRPLTPEPSCETNPISPGQGQTGGWPTGLLDAGRTPGREFSGNALLGGPTIVYS